MFTKRTLLAYIALASTVVVFLSPLNELLAYNRNSSFAVWTALSTASYTHLSLPHLLVNMFALLVIYYLFIEDITVKTQIMLLASLTLAVGIGIHFFSDIERYTGFSGVCHGVLIAGALLTLERKDRWINILVLFGTGVKLAEEYLSDDRSSPLFNTGYVAIEAHQFGALGAIVFSMLYYLIKLLLRTDHPKA